MSGPGSANASQYLGSKDHQFSALTLDRTAEAGQGKQVTLRGRHAALEDYRGRNVGQEAPQK